MITKKVINGIQITSGSNTFLKRNKPIWSRVMWKSWYRRIHDMRIHGWCLQNFYLLTRSTLTGESCLEGSDRQQKLDTLSKSKCRLLIPKMMYNLLVFFLYTIQLVSHKKSL